MTITKNDIVLFQSQDNTDNDSGGGSRTSYEIVDGDVNNLFPDISRLDTVAGRVNLRKAFPTVTTDNNDVYYGAHSIITSVPNDPNVSALLFHTDDPHDTRLEAQDKIENYVVASYLESFYLYGNHVEGSKTVTFLQLLESREPETGEVYLLKESNVEQYIRISDISSEERTFVDSKGDSYIRRQIICIIDQPLEFAFTGSSFQPQGQENNTADSWATQVADAAKFYSTKSLGLAAAAGDTSITVDSIFEQIVPASTSKSFLTNKQVLGTKSIYSPTGTTELYISHINGSSSVGSPVIPNSITKFYTTEYQDDGDGNIRNSQGTGSIVGHVDYDTGNFSGIYFVSGNVSVELTTAAIMNVDTQFTGEIKVTNENVGNVFISRLSPIPSTGALIIDYRSNGKWYRYTSTGLRTDGVEALGDDPLIGTGVLYDNGDGTGTVNITLASPADIDSAVIITWGTSEFTINDQGDKPVELVIDTGETYIDPLSFSMMTFSAPQNTYYEVTALSDGTLVDSVASGYRLTGRLDAESGLIYITGTESSGRIITTGNDSTITFNYANLESGDVGSVKTVVASRTADVDQIQFGLEDTNTGSLIVDLGEFVDVHSLAVDVKVVYKYNQYPVTVSLRSNSAGSLIKSGTTEVWGSVSAAGVITFAFPTFTYKSYSYTSSYLNVTDRVVSDNIRHVKVGSSYNDGDEIIIKYTTASAESYTESASITGELINLAEWRLSIDTSLIGEVAFTLPKVGGEKYYSSDGVIYQSNGLQQGEIDYATGEMKIKFIDTAITENYFATFNKLFLDLHNEDTDKTSQFTFRTASSKLTTSSFQMVYDTINGSYTATSDAEGVITGTDIDSTTSYVDTRTGMAHIEFTDAAIAESIRYDAVAETSLPLDPELLGLNPVRLPSDGRVPVFKSGYIVVVFHTAITPVTGDTPVADQVQVLDRDSQALIEVVDGNGRRLDPTQYTTDRATGSITFNNTLVLEDKYGTALVAPYSIVDRIEDMVMLNDVQINGKLGLSGALTHEYPENDTKVASALVFGDTGSRVYNLFTQEYWNSGSPEWSDVRIGDDTTAKYDTINYPLMINNVNSTAERWSVIFTSSTTVKVVGEKLGVVETSVSIGVDDIAPLNPATGEPYFLMSKEGFGGGWVTNNVIRFNTDSGDNNMWVIRTIQAGALSETTDSIDLEVRGDAN